MDVQKGSASEGPAKALAEPEGAFAGPSSVIEKRPHSAVTSGRKLLMDGDVNSAWSRRYRDVINDLTSDLGGRSMIGEAKAAIIRDCAALEIVLEKMRGKMSPKPMRGLPPIVAGCLKVSGWSAWRAT